jgi:hypothetical protein
MKKILIASAAALGVMASGASAQASTIYIGYTYDAANNAPPGSSPVSGVITATFSGIVGIFKVNVVTATDTYAPDPASLLTTFSDSTLAKNGSAAHTIRLFATETGLTGPVGSSLIYSSLTENTLKPGWVAEQWTWWNPSNAKYGQQDLLLNHTFTATGLGTDENAPVPGLPYVITAPYSLTEELLITVPASGSKGTSGASELIQTISIPETSTWAMLGIGFAGIGLLGVSKRRKAPRYAL